MSKADQELRGLARSFLTGRESFWSFHEEFLSRWGRLPETALSEGEWKAWNEVYAWVLTAIPDPVPGPDAARGVIGETELRNRLGRHSLVATP